MGTDMGKEKKDAENAENREIEQELRRRLRSLDREIPVPDKASAEQLLYRLQAQNGRKSRIPSWVRTLSLGLACCFVAVFGLWGFFSGAFGALFGSKNLSTGEGSTLQGYRAGDSFSSSAASDEEEYSSELADSSGSFLIESVTYSGMTDGGDLYYISRSYSDLQKLLYGQDGGDSAAGEFAGGTGEEDSHGTPSEQTAPATSSEMGTVCFIRRRGPSTS